MANEQNLRPFTGEQSREKARENGRKGGIRSGEAKREKKLWKEEICKKLNAKDFDEIIDGLIKRAKKNDKSFEILRDTMGQKPKEEINIETKLPVFNIEITDNSELEKKFEEYETNAETD